MGIGGRREVGIAEIEDSRLQAVGAAVGRGVAELPQGVEAPAYDRARESGGAADIGDGETPVDAGECADHVQSARERSHEVRIAAPVERLIRIGRRADARRDQRTRAPGGALGCNTTCTYDMQLPVR